MHNAWASKFSADNWYPAGRSSYGSAGHRSSPAKTSVWASDDTLFAKITGVVEFKDRGRMGKYVSIKPE